VISLTTVGLCVGAIRSNATREQGTCCVASSVRAQWDNVFLLRMLGYLTWLPPLRTIGLVNLVPTARSIADGGGDLIRRLIDWFSHPVKISGQQLVWANKPEPS
jgi:hypothetical protein